MRQKDLAASLGLDGSSVVRLLDALQEAGLVERREDDEDRRAKAIHLTAKGRATVAQVEAVFREVRNQVLAPLSDKEIAIASGVLERILEALAALEDGAS
jgi:MarR family transcriptional regulator for hemolysin